MEPRILSPASARLWMQQRSTPFALALHPIFPEVGATFPDIIVSGTKQPVQTMLPPETALRLTTDCQFRAQPNLL